MKKCLLFTVLMVFAYSVTCNAQVVSIMKFGAIGDGKTLNTNAIQQSIDYCNKQGLGWVVIPNGVFLTGSIFLKSGVDI